MPNLLKRKKAEASSSASVRMELKLRAALSSHVVNAPLEIPVSKVNKKSGKLGKLKAEVVKNRLILLNEMLVKSGVSKAFEFVQVGNVFRLQKVRFDEQSLRDSFYAAAIATMKEKFNAEHYPQLTNGYDIFVDAVNRHRITFNERMQIPILSPDEYPKLVFRDLNYVTARKKLIAGIVRELADGKIDNVNLSVIDKVSSKHDLPSLMISSEDVPAIDEIVIKQAFLPNNKIILSKDEMIEKIRSELMKSANANGAISFSLFDDKIEKACEEFYFDKNVAGYQFLISLVKVYQIETAKACINEILNPNLDTSRQSIRASLAQSLAVNADAKIVIKAADRNALCEYFGIEVVQASSEIAREGLVPPSSNNAMSSSLNSFVGGRRAQIQSSDNFNPLSSMVSRIVEIDDEAAAPSGATNSITKNEASRPLMRDDSLNVAADGYNVLINSYKNEIENYLKLRKGARSGFFFGLNNKELTKKRVELAEIIHEALEKLVLMEDKTDIRKRLDEVITSSKIINNHYQLSAGFGHGKGELSKLLNLTVDDLEARYSPR